MIRVLIVDDHAILRRGLRALLSDEFHGAAFGEAADAVEALEQLRKKEWDVALLDMTMPGMSGRQTYETLQKIMPGIKVLLSSGYSIEGQAQALLDSGCNGFIQKPFAFPALREKLQEIFPAS